MGKYMKLAINQSRNGGISLAMLTTGQSHESHHPMDHGDHLSRPADREPQSQSEPQWPWSNSRRLSKMIYAS